MARKTLLTVLAALLTASIMGAFEITGGWSFDWDLGVIQLPANVPMWAYNINIMLW